MKRLILLIGPPGCGKTTYCLKHLKDFVRISQDDLGKIAHFHRFCIGLTQYEDMVIDRMNFNRKQREKYISPAIQTSYKTIIGIVLTPPPYEVCLNRLLQRKDHPTIKNEENAKSALKLFLDQFEEPSLDEGFTTIIKHKFKEEGYDHVHISS